MLNLKHAFAKWNDNVQVQLNTEVYSSSASIYTKSSITVILLRLAWVEGSCEK